MARVPKPRKPPKVRKRLNYFSDRERESQEQFANWRTHVIGPIVRPWQRWGLTADHLTLTGVLLLIPYAYCFAAGHLEVAAVLVWICVLFDGLDGVYARVTGTASEGGALADAFGDQLVAIVTVLLVIHTDLAPPVWAAYYGIVYVIMIALSMYQNALGIPMQIILRSKYLLYLAVGIYAYGELNLIPWLMMLFSIIMTYHCLESFLKIKRHLDSSE